ncbi:MAG: hypothetical protein K6G72_10195 [Lachnospiraceae bacterium]|nr:hypothetical protein [Lachnospiraceae bacterium]
MKIYRHIFAVLSVFAMVFAAAGTRSFAEGALNTYAKTFSYTNNSGKTFGATLKITSSREADWELTADKENDETQDGFVYYRLKAKGEPGDVIDISVTSEYPDTLLGVTVLPKIKGSWKPGTQKTLFVKEDENTITESTTIGEDVSDLQVSVSAYSKSFGSKKPGSMDVILTIETPAHVDAAVSDGSGVKFLLTITAGILMLVVLAVFLGKRNARKAARSE